MVVEIAKHARSMLQVAEMVLCKLEMSFVILPFLLLEISFDVAIAVKLYHHALVLEKVIDD
jgi:uncharacterized membrane protein